MAFKFKSASEDDDTYKNIHEDELFDTSSIYYDMWVSKISNDKKEFTEEQKNKYKELREKWLNEEYKMADLRKKSLYEGLDLFKKYFYDLWD